MQNSFLGELWGKKIKEFVLLRKSAKLLTSFFFCFFFFQIEVATLVSLRTSFKGRLRKEVI